MVRPARALRRKMPLRVSKCPEEPCSPLDAWRVWPTDREGCSDPESQEPTSRRETYRAGAPNQPKETPVSFIRVTSVAVAAVGLLTLSAAAQEKGGGAAGGVGTAGAAAPAGGAAPVRPSEGTAPGGAGAPRPASPGMAPSGSAQTAPGPRNPGENVGESPAQKPAAPGEAAGQGKPAGQGGNQAPGKSEANGQAGKENRASRPAPQVTNVQETKIRQTIKAGDVHPVQVNFNVGVGVAVPASVALRPLPPAIIDVVPGYEGYRFFVAPGQIVIVDPLSLEIVAILPL